MRSHAHVPDHVVELIPDLSQVNKHNVMQIRGGPEALKSVVSDVFGSGAARGGLHKIV